MPVQVGNQLTQLLICTREVVRFYGEEGKGGKGGLGVGAGIGAGFELSLLPLPPPPQAVNEVANSVNMIARLKKLFDSSVCILNSL